MTTEQPCDRRLIHGAHTYVDTAGTDHRCPGSTTAGPPVSWRQRLDRVIGDPCGFCGKRGSHYCDLRPPAGPGTSTGRVEHLVHGRLLDGTVLCPDAVLDPETPYATVFLDVVTCEVCAGRLARIQGRPTAVPAEPRAVRPARARLGRKVGAA